MKIPNRIRPVCVIKTPSFFKFLRTALYILIKAPERVTMEITLNGFPIEKKKIRIIPDIIWYRYGYTQPYNAFAEVSP